MGESWDFILQSRLCKTAAIQERTCFSQSEKEGSRSFGERIEQALQGTMWGSLKASSFGRNGWALCSWTSPSFQAALSTWGWSCGAGGPVGTGLSRCWTLPSLLQAPAPSPDGLCWYPISVLRWAGWEHTQTSYGCGYTWVTAVASELSPWKARCVSRVLVPKSSLLSAALRPALSWPGGEISGCRLEWSKAASSPSSRGFGGWLCAPQEHPLQLRAPWEVQLRKAAELPAAALSFQMLFLRVVTVWMHSWISPTRPPPLSIPSYLARREFCQIL